MHVHISVQITIIEPYLTKNILRYLTIYKRYRVDDVFLFSSKRVEKSSTPKRENANQNAFKNNFNFQKF